MTKEPTKTNAEVEAEARVSEAVTRINAALAETGTLLQPFIERNPMASIARVRIVIKAPEEEEDLSAEIKTTDETGSKKTKRS